MNKITKASLRQFSIIDLINIIGSLLYKYGIDMYVRQSINDPQVHVIIRSDVIVDELFHMNTVKILNK